MIRNLDLTALRSFVTVAESGGVTRAGARLNLTQSAVSMQLKRLEEALNQPLLDRAGRGVKLTPQGEQLLLYGRKLIALNDEIWGRMTNEAFEGEIRFGVPYDIIYQHVPNILKRFACEYPRVKVQLISNISQTLREELDRGALDVIIATEPTTDVGGEVLTEQPLVWVGARAGKVWRQRPLRIGSVIGCSFRQPVFDALDGANIEWQNAVEGVACSAVEASVAADLVVYAQLRDSVLPQLETIAHGGALPQLPNFFINMYVDRGPNAALAEKLAEMLRDAYRTPDRIAAE